VDQRAAEERTAQEKAKRDTRRARKKARRAAAKREREGPRLAEKKKKKHGVSSSGDVDDEVDATTQWQRQREEAVALEKLKAVGQSLFEGENMSEDQQQAILNAYEKEMAELDAMMEAEEAEMAGRDRGGQLFAAALDADVFSGGFSEETLRATFDAIDEDGSGELDEEEIANVMSSLGKGADPEEVKEMIELADEDGNGVIDFEEFKILMAELARRKDMRAEEESVVTANAKGK
jgi:hypothetical protein